MTDDVLPQPPILSTRGDQHAPLDAEATQRWKKFGSWGKVFFPTLLGITDMKSLLGHPVLGHSWEAHVVESLLAVTPPEVQASYYRSSAGAEEAGRLGGKMRQ